MVSSGFLGAVTADQQRDWAGFSGFLRLAEPENDGGGDCGRAFESAGGIGTREIRERVVGLFGKVGLSAGAEELYRNPRHPCTRALISGIRQAARM